MIAKGRKNRQRKTNTLNKQGFVANLVLTQCNECFEAYYLKKSIVVRLVVLCINC